MTTAQSGLLKWISEMERFSSGQGMLILIWWMYLICEWSYEGDHFGEWRKLRAKPNHGEGKSYISGQNFWFFHHLRYKSWTSQACRRWEDYWDCWSRGSWWNLDKPWNQDESWSSMETTEEHCQRWDWERFMLKTAPNVEGVAVAYVKGLTTDSVSSLLFHWKHWWNKSFW